MIDGFKVVPLKHREHRDTWHEIFIQEFKRKKLHPKLPIGKTLLILNVPPYIEENHLKFGFEKAGNVAEVTFTKNPEEPIDLQDEITESKYFPLKQTKFRFKCAYVIFNTTKSLLKALELPEIQLYENSQTILQTGMKKWTQDFLSSRTNETELKREIEGFLSIFDAEEEVKNERVEQEIDDEGWETVTKGRNSRFVQSERVLKKLQDKLEAGQKKKELVDFYKFQKNSGKQSRVKNLRRKFGEAMDQVEEMKSAKRLKSLSNE